MKPRPYQTLTIDKILARYSAGDQSTLCVLPTGAGKCLARGTPVLMFDGSVRPVEDVRAGDLLMGPDSTPRVVLSTCSGRDRLYRVVPTKGDPYIVNAPHVLSLKMTKGASKGSGTKGGLFSAGTIINIPVEEYVKKSKTFKHCAKGWRVGVDFPHQCYQPIEPYFLGLWLGDGTARCAEITTADEEIKSYLREYAAKEGMRFVEKLQANNKSTVCAISRTVGTLQRNRLVANLRALDIFQNKHIPLIYKATDRLTRLQLLAGIIDSDGSLGHAGYDYISVSERLAEDVAYVARSLGMAAYVKRCRKTCVNNGVSGTYYRVSISGNVSDIPVRIPRKKAPVRRQKKDVLVTGIRVEEAGEGEYFGFEISGDRMFLLGDFTVTHNTVVFGLLSKAFLETHPGRVLILCHREELIRQAAAKLEAITGIKCAIEKASEWSNELSMYGKPRIVVASIQSMASRKGDGKRMHRFNPADFGLVVLDEAHHAVAGTWKAVVGHFCQNAALKVLGVTATADRADGEKLGIIFQSIAHEYPLPDIIHDGYLVPIKQLSVVIEGLDFSKVKTCAGDLNAGDLEAAMMFEKPLHGVMYATIELACGLPQGALREIADDPDRANKAAVLIGENRRRKTLIFAVTVKHAERMAEIINRWIPESATHIDGTMSEEMRRQRFKAYAEGRVQFLCNVMVATEGFDEPGVEVVVMARPTKSRSLFCQMIGRGTRPAYAIAGAIGELETAEDRLACIANSDKPFCEVLDFVGNSGKHKLVSTLDVLGGEAYSPEELKLAAEMVQGESLDAMKALESAKEELARRRREAEKKQREREEAEERRREAEAAKRAMLVGMSNYSATDINGFDPYAPRITRQMTQGNGAGIDQWTRARLEKAKVPAAVINNMSPEKAKALSAEIKRRWKAGLCSYRQAEVLRRVGYSKCELHEMTYEAASAEIEQVKKNGWKRPRQEAAA